jgi:hypothetical protein
MSKVYEADVIDDLQGNLEVANSTINEWKDRTHEFKDYVQGLFIDVYSQDEYNKRIDAIFNETFKELKNEHN